MVAPGLAGATGRNSITSPDTDGDVGEMSSLALDASGNPVVSYYDDTNGDLKVLHCNDPNCAGGGESISSPDTQGDVGWHTSLALDASGNPVVSYHDVTNGNLKVLHCNDPNCGGGGESITSPDTDGDVGYYTSLALDASGNPVVSYQDEDEDDLKVLHCDDPDCAGDEGPNITSPGSGVNFGGFPSLALDASGNPVVSYNDWSGTNDLWVLHCNDPDCSGGDESITSPDALGILFTSLVLDGSGNPVVSYYSSWPGDLRVVRCGNPNCTSGNAISSPDTDGDVGWWPSLALDASGNPVVSYHDDTNGDLKVLHCNYPNCAPVDVHVTDQWEDESEQSTTERPEEARARLASLRRGPYDYVYGLLLCKDFSGQCEVAVATAPEPGSDLQTRIALIAASN